MAKQLDAKIEQVKGKGQASDHVLKENPEEFKQPHKVLQKQ